MTASTRPSERRRRSIGLALLAAVVLTGFASLPPRVGEDLLGGTEFAIQLDLTEDIYHRVRSGLFVPEAEPLIMRSKLPQSFETAEDLVGQQVFASDAYLRFTWDQGTFDVRTDNNGLVVLHLDDEAAMSHLSVCMPPKLSSMTREFPERPAHPVR